MGNLYFIHRIHAFIGEKVYEVPYFLDFLLG